MTTHILLPDPHTKHDTSNERFDWFSKLIKDVKPDVVINGGDHWDMESLSSYDKGKASFYGRAYKKDIDAGLEANERLWEPIKRSKKKMPRRVFLTGNHEHRLHRVLQYQSELEGTIGPKDFDLERYYDDIVEYEGATPGRITIDNILYAHFFVSGVKGLPVGGANPARMLLQKQHVSATSFHLHLVDWAVETTGKGNKIMGMFAGVGHDRIEDFAGASSELWWPGVIIKHNVDNGCYDPQFISLKTLQKEYGK
jgi:predicted MPP superfamily phosphohydrolase